MMYAFLNRNERAILQRKATQNLQENELKQAKKRYDLAKLDRQDKNESLWFRCSLLLVGVFVGFLAFRVVPDVLQRYPAYTQQKTQHRQLRSSN